MTKNYNFTGDWISGFTQSDGSFIVSFLNKNKGVFIRPQPVFNLTQSISELEMFLALQKYLGVGNIYRNRKNVVFVVKSIDEIVEVILPLFDKHPVRAGKFLAYNIFKEVSLLVKNKEHLTDEGTLKILKLAYFMNKETSLRNQSSFKILTEKLKIKPDYSEAPLTKIFILFFFTEPCGGCTEDKLNNPGPLTLEFVRGLIDGDGSFNVSFATTRRRVVVNFTVVNELSSISVLNELVEFFKCGAVYKLPSVAARFQVQSNDELLNKIIPIFKDTEFNTKKQKSFKIIIKVCELIKEKGYSNNSDLRALVEMAWDMNKSNRRKISKQEYLNLFCKS